MLKPSRSILFAGMSEPREGSMYTAFVHGEFGFYKNKGDHAGE